METDEQRIRSVWNNQGRSVLLRRTKTGEKPRLRLEGQRQRQRNHYFWLRNGRRNKPSWIEAERYWETPQAWFNDTVSRCLEDFGSIYIIQPYREQEKCAPACQNAKGQLCQCSCMGKNHGAQSIDSSWYVVGETFASRWGDKKLACRLLTAN